MYWSHIPLRQADLRISITEPMGVSQPRRLRDLEYLCSTIYIRLSLIISLSLGSSSAIYGNHEPSNGSGSLV